MATTNPFDLLGDSENDDPSLLVAAQEKKLATNKPVVPSSAASAPAAAKLPSKPLPPAQAVRDSRNSAAPAREGTGRGGPGRGRGGRGERFGQNRDFENGSVNRHGSGRGGFAIENGDGDNLSERNRGGSGQYRGSFRGGRRGGYANGDGEGAFDSERPPRRVYERRSGTGIGHEMKRDGAGRGNWGTVTDEVFAQNTEENLNLDEKVASLEKQVVQDDGKEAGASKDKIEDAANEAKKEPEDNEMTLEEYEKIREEKRKSLLSMKAEERKVEIDKDLQSMQQLTIKKGNDDVFIKLNSEKDSLKHNKENSEKEERARKRFEKKVMSINEFLKPAEGERYGGLSGRGRGRGRGGERGLALRGASIIGASIPPSAVVIPSIEDKGQFPTLGGAK